MIENIIRFLFACVFLFFAFVQWNDPDPLLWMINYCIGAILSLKYISKINISKWIFRLALGYIGIQLIILAYRVIGKQHMMHAEDGREFLGLIIVFLWLFLLDIYSKKTKNI